MIRQFYIENFKSFAEPTTANLDDLLVIAGSNSGGKSTIIQALLLLSQTLENPRPDVVLDLGGKYIQFAEFSEAVFGRPNSLDTGFTIGFDVDVDESDPLSEDVFKDIYLRKLNIGTSRRSKRDKSSKTTNSICIRITFGSDRSGTPLIQSAVYEKNINGLGKVTLSIIRDRGSKYRTTIERNSRSDKKTISPDDILRRFEKVISESETQSSARSRRVSYERFFMEPFIKFGFLIEEVPSIGGELVKIVQNVDGVKTDQENIHNIFLDILRYTFKEELVTRTLQKMPFDHFLLPLFFPRVLSIGEEKAVFRIEEGMYRYVRFFDAMFGQAISEIRNFLRKIKYIGPLRAKPERAYLAIGSPIDIGNAGENAVPILWLYQNDKILSKTSIGGETNERKLVLAVQDWLQEFGIAYSFHITKPKRVIYQAELESAPGSKTMVTIADVGFGVSQLLPVIVAGLRAPKDSTLVLEQPEIHLHPRLQGKLADFLICMVELGKKVIVETHSEHLINMLRLRIAQDKSGNLQKKIGIIFVRNWQQLPALQRKAEDKDRQGSYIENLRVDEYGKIINWPPDFFPETTNLNEEILKAMMEKFPGGE